MLMPYPHRERAVSAITGAFKMPKMRIKQLFGFKQGKVSIRKEIRRQARLRKNLQRSIYRKLNILLPRHIRRQAKTFEESGLFSRTQSYRVLENELLFIMRQHYRRVFITVFKEYEARYEKINKSVDVSVFNRNKDIEDLIEIYLNDRVLFLARMGQAVTNDIQNIISNARAEGLSLNQISKKIMKRVPVARSRAAAIARTETHNAASFANHSYHEIVGKEYDVRMVKRWTATNDLRTRSAHSSVNGQIRPMDEPFNVDGAEMMHTGDPKGGARNNVNCRCVVIYIDADEVDNLQ